MRLVCSEAYHMTPQQVSESYPRRFIARYYMQKQRSEHRKWMLYTQAHVSTPLRDPSWFSDAPSSVQPTVDDEFTQLKAEYKRKKAAGLPMTPDLMSDPTVRRVAM